MNRKHIALITDDNYCLPTAVCIQSIISSLSDNIDIVIHVCTFGLNDYNTNKLTNLSNEKTTVIVDTFNIDNYRDKLSLVNQKSHVSPTALIKFELPNFYSNIDTLLYLDGDIIVKGDLSALLNIDLECKYMASSFEFWTYITAVKYTLKRTVPFYFNSGVMLMNLRKMREDKITEKLWFHKLNSTKTKLMDQESLNAVCASNSLSLPVKWNFNPIFAEEGYVRYINKLYGTKYRNVQELLDDVCIIHYVGKSDKPWIFKGARLRKYWDESNRKMPHPETLLLKEAIEPSCTLCSSLVKKIKDHGIIGTILYIVYLIKQHRYKRI